MISLLIHNWPNRIFKLSARRNFKLRAREWTATPSACEGEDIGHFFSSVYFYTVRLFLIHGFLIKWESSEEDGD
ncbi:hypothetical protein E2C01_017366 [Portunus trituberculatus]|uniref:Uncharacterized protein n=1 Tax=Portunus trituberculatus TaxID=210409 RepID=A0A5B7DT66_PORTR|nr:hypothetical protein [Portunus trituberculatus]